MLRVDERDDAAHRLGLCQNLEREGRLTRGLGAINLYDSASGHTTYAERCVQRERACRDGLDLEVRAIVAVPHDGALAKLLDDLRRGRVDHLLALFSVRLLVHLAHGTLALGHNPPLLFHQSKSYTNNRSMSTLIPHVSAAHSQIFLTCLVELFSLRFSCESKGTRWCRVPN